MTSDMFQLNSIEGEVRIVWSHEVRTGSRSDRVVSGGSHSPTITNFFTTTAEDRYRPGRYRSRF